VPAPIYHLAPLSEWRHGRRGNVYTPARFAEDGFIHCAATAESVLAVARDYFVALEEPLLVACIDPDRLRARLVFEAPAPIAGGGTSHITPGAAFPHIYGALELEAVSGVAILVKRGGDFLWPGVFLPANAL